MSREKRYKESSLSLTAPARLPGLLAQGDGTR
jgi:hypothetical protein